MELLTGELLALDLINTRAHTPNGEVDALDRIEDFHAWLAAQADRLTPPSVSLTTADLAAVRELRGHVADAVDRVRHGHASPPKSIHALNNAIRAAPAYKALALDDRALIARFRRDGTERARLLAQLAEAAVDLLTNPDIVKVRRCEGPQCRMLFLPAHPRRRWCSPARCGNRVRVGRYYERHNR